ncbi:MAG: tRNA1(Val) (adenine(37)-N6)-methyltransferase [Clostridia bacterium]|nr:tRNA1(Val) (adenine(37)-N6)-methyltransferase [Clostridia bacterium]
MNVTLLDNERIDDLEIDGLRIIQKKDGFCFGMDSVLISDFARIFKRESIVADLGTGTGIISVLISAKNEKIKKVYGFDIQEDMVEMAQRSVKMNELENKIEIVQRDIVGISKGRFNKFFDVVVTNPPYKKVSTGLVNDNEKKLISRHEIKCTLEDVIYESSKILKDNGIFYMVHRPERLVEIIELMRKNKIEPKEIRFVYPHINDEANLVMIKGVKCGKTFLKILQPLIVYNEQNEYTDEIYKIYGKKL